MLLVACAATHGRPNVTMHDSSACQKPAPFPDVIQHGWSSCIATHGPLGVKTMPCRALGVMLHVRLHPAERCRATETLRCLDEGQHVLIPQIGPPRASRTLVLGLSTLALPVDCLDDFGPRGLSVQYTQDVRGCPPAHTGCLWLSVSTLRTSVGVRQYTYQHVGRSGVSASTHKTSVAVCMCPCVSVCLCQHIQDVCGCPSVLISARWSMDSACWPFPWTVWVILAHVVCLVSTHRKSVGVRQYTQDVCGCPSAHTGRLWLSVCVCVYPSAHTEYPWLSISTHISTRVLGLSMLALPVDCSGDFGPRGLSVQYKQDVRGCPSAHTGRLWMSISIDISTLVLGFSMMALPVDCSGDFGPRGLSVQYTQDVRGCPQVPTRHPWLSVAVCQHTHDVHGCPCVFVCIRQHIHDVHVCPSAHTQDVNGCPSYTQDVRGCPPAHTGRLWLSISTHISMLVLGLSTLALPMDCLGYFGTRGLSVQYTQDVHGCPPAHRTSVAIRGCPSAHTGRPWLSVCVRVSPWVSASTHMTSVAVHGCPTHISTLVLELSTLALPVDCLGDFGPRGLSVQYTQDVRGTHRMSVAVHQYTYQHAGPWTQHAGPSRGLFSTHKTSVSVCVWPCVSVSTHRTSVAVHHTHRTSLGVRQHTQDVLGCPCVSVCVRQHTQDVWLSISTHISTLVLGLSTLALPVDCLGDFGPRGLSVQYTQDVRGCPPGHTGCLWLSVSTHRTFMAVRVYSCGSVSTHKTSVAVHQYTYQHAGPWTQHAGPSCGLLGTSVAVRVCPSVHTGSPWLSISTHISTLVLGLRTLTLPVDYSGDFGPRGLSVQYTQDVRGCLPAHKGRPWVSASTHRTSVAVRVCPCVSVSTHIIYVAVYQYTYQLAGPWTQYAGPWTQHAGPSRGLFG
ncbi:hypothetical protein YC2023_066235 [Brassica napus]